MTPAGFITERIVIHTRMSISEPIAVGVKVFKRTEKLANLLNSLRDEPVTCVYIADDGHTEERRDLYRKEYPFELNILDLEFDAGLGVGRRRVVEALDEPYLLFLDSDHTVVDLAPLYEVLTADDSLGGVAGLLYKTNGEIQANAHDLFETRDGDVLIRDIRGQHTVDRVGGHSLFRFDYVPNAGLYRRECLKEYAWDPAYVIGKDHLDFYLGHKRRTDWEFGICPEVLFGHDPGGSDSYLLDRLDTRKTWASKEYFLEKWDYDQIVTRRHWSAISDDEQSLGRLVQRTANRLGVGDIPLATQRRLIDLHDIGMRAKADLYEYLAV
jgi:glycosyltransferase involved in cell wall biosynthesis